MVAAEDFVVVEEVDLDKIIEVENNMEGNMVGIVDFVDIDVDIQEILAYLHKRALTTLVAKVGFWFVVIMFAKVKVYSNHVVDIVDKD